MSSARIVRLDAAQPKGPARKKGIGLTETERQLLLAEIMAELDELHDRAAGIAARVKTCSSSTRLAG
jgi:hypothetical protein